MLTRLLAWITGGVPVVLEDHQGRAYNTVAYRNAFGTLWCYVYPISRVGHVTLDEDGTASPNSFSSYIHRWKEVRSDE